MNKDKKSNPVTRSHTNGNDKYVNRYIFLCIYTVINVSMNHVS